MIKMIGVFVALWIGIALGIQQVLHMTNQERWSLIKVGSYALWCAGLTVIILSIIVVLF